MEEDYNEMDDFEELKQCYFDLGHEFRSFVIKYDIKHDLIKEKTINIFLKQKAFVYLLSEKPDDEPIDYTDDNTPAMNNKQEKHEIENAKEEKEDKKKETINDLKEEIHNNNNQKQQETIDCLKDNNKKQQEVIDSLKQEMINLKEKNNKNQQEQTKINNSTVNNDDKEPLDEELLLISNIWNDPTMNNKNSLIRDILDKSIINDIMADESIYWMMI